VRELAGMGRDELRTVVEGRAADAACRHAAADAAPLSTTTTRCAAQRGRQGCRPAPRPAARGARRVPDGDSGASVQSHLRGRPARRLR
jgi:hypothetical protein